MSRTRPVVLVTPAPAASRAGNRVTVLRWARILRGFGLRVRVTTRWDGEPASAMVALHARKSASSALRFRAAHPDRPLVVAMGGTDLYPDLRRFPLAMRACEAADRIVVLQAHALRDLPRSLRPRARVIVQSAACPPARRGPAGGEVRACVLAHLRPVKDPFLPERAVRLLPVESRVRVEHAGAALGAAQERRARAASAGAARWRWRGDLPRPRALRFLAG